MSEEPAKLFQRMWEEPNVVPEVFDFLKQLTAATVVETLEVLLVDQQFRWSRTIPLPVQEYLRRLPELLDHSFVYEQLIDSDLRLQQLSLTGAVERPDHNFPIGCSSETHLELKLEEAKAAERSTNSDDPTTSQVQGDSDHDGFPLQCEIRSGSLPRGDDGTTDHSRSNSDGPQHLLGRYRLIRQLGSGAFGDVYLANDDELCRRVAVKIPRPERFQKVADAERFLAEARILAGLNHPHIVAVYDVGRTDDGVVYIVSRYIEGGTLNDRLREQTPSFAESAALVAQVARALHSAHLRRLVHRDIKPANLLLEPDQWVPYVSDFGLAISEDEFLIQRTIVGTPSYMSPEQARGEGHRLDGRSDIFSLGSVFYRMLTGRRPFLGASPDETLCRVITVDPPTPEDLDATIPKELNRICMKMLSKRASDRYSSAGELADDLENWRSGLHTRTKSGTVMPKGLRSYDAADAGFFLELLPGPFDRGGLPESIRFWKTRIEETDTDRTFSVGLIYGPSGCGKSSMVKAGLIPHLSTDITTLYVEATQDDTENRILRAMQRAFPELVTDRGLAESFAAFRRTGHRKLVLIIDQFEQWLLQHSGQPDTPLVNALRQCDGSILQSILMIRDEFAMAAARLMETLDIPILQGHNFATVDMFSADHARRVLFRLGQAFGKLPPGMGDLTPDQNAFLDAVTTGLSVNDKVISVQLALFSEMVKGKPWNPETLDLVGGTEGVGANFLKETFGARSANPMLRAHQQAARDLLSALLPDPGTDIKGHHRSYQELLKICGYESRPREFEQLIRSLDGELRLITPTDPELMSNQSDSGTTTQSYQLTHDFLVTAIREWLTAGRQQSRRGRAEIRLAERTTLWTRFQERKQLPSLAEWLSIRIHTNSRRWSTSQSRMMDVARAMHLSRLGVAVLILIGLTLTAATVRRYQLQHTERQRIAGLVDNLWSSRTDGVPALLTSLLPHREQWESQVRSVATDPTSDELRQIRAKLALAAFDTSHLSDLQEHLMRCEAAEQRIFRDILRSQADLLCQACRREIIIEDGDPLRRIRAAAVLADYAPDNVRWEELAESLVTTLVRMDPFLVNPWIDELSSVRRHFRDPLIAVARDHDSPSNERLLAAGILKRFSGMDRHLLHADQFAELVLDADLATYRVLEPMLRDYSDSLTTILRTELSTIVLPADSPEARRRLDRQCHAALTLLHLGEPSAFRQCLADRADPRIRTLLIHQMSQRIPEPSILLSELAVSRTADVRQSILIALADFRPQPGSTQESGWTAQLRAIAREDSDPGVVAAAEWLLRRNHHRLIGSDLIGSDAESILHSEPSTGSRTHSARHSNCLANGTIMVRIPAPGLTLIGVTGDDVERDGQRVQRSVDMNYTFEISDSEITVEQFLAFIPDYPYAANVTPGHRCAVNRIDVFNAMRFCRWLSEQESGFRSENCCYPPISEIEPGMRLSEGFHRKSGYRLPMQSEWEFAARAGSRTTYFFGNDESMLPLYSWVAANANELVRDVRKLRPNSLGLFDLYGNVSEWCHPDTPHANPDEYDVCGGHYRSTPRFLRTSMVETDDGAAQISIRGFRIARTVNANTTPRSESGR